MKKKLLFISAVFCTTGLFAQNSDLNLNYIENLYHATDNANLNGSARYRALSGAMGALGGDLSATNKNPAGAAVFLGSEFSITAGTTSTEIDGDLNGYSVGDKSNEFKIPQLGGVIVFNDLASNNFTNLAISLNYEETENDEFFNYDKLNKFKTDSLDGFVSDVSTLNSTTNISIAASYRDQIYFGLGFNAKRYESVRFNALSEYDGIDDQSYVYTQDYSPNSVIGDGFSITAGVIGRVTPEFRLGFSYESPTWYKDVEEDSFEYFIEENLQTGNSYYFAGRDPLFYVNDLTSGQKITGSAAYIFGKSGLISSDVTITDYSIAELTPKNSFNSENAFIEDFLKTSIAFNLGAEYRIQDFMLRGGYRYISSPFESVDLNLSDNSSYQPYGDLNGFSVGLGYTFHNFFIDASYNIATQERNVLLSGNYYNFNGEVQSSSLNSDPDVAINEALEILSLDSDNRGYSTSIQDIDKKWSDFVVSVGLRF